MSPGLVRLLDVSGLRGRLATRRRRRRQARAVQALHGWPIPSAAPQRWPASQPPFQGPTAHFDDFGQPTDRFPQLTARGPAKPPPPAVTSRRTDARWTVVSDLPAEPWLQRARRSMGILGLVLVVLAGSSTIVAHVIDWVRPRPSTQPLTPSDADFRAAAAGAVADYLTWDEADRSSRPAVLSRFGARPSAGTAGQSQPVDGWNGKGRQWADSAVAVASLRMRPDMALITVQVRATPLPPPIGAAYNPTTDRQPPPRNSSTSAPPSTAPGPPQPANRSQWLTMTVALVWHDPRFELISTPALVGSPPTNVPGTPWRAGTGDATFAQATQETVTRLMSAYGTGDLQFVRAPATQYAGLSGTASLEAVTAWRVAPADENGQTRTGEVTVVWRLPDGASTQGPAPNPTTLTCTYLVGLRWQGDRWLLQSVTADWGAP